MCDKNVNNFSISENLFSTDDFVAVLTGYNVSDT